MNPLHPLLLVLDVDGVLTDGRLAFDETGAGGKTFFVQDGAALGLWREAGGRLAILSGRTSPAVARRAEELRADLLLQGVPSKSEPFLDACRRCGALPRQACYVGDDWPDLAPMRACGYAVAVANAVAAVKRAAAYVTQRPGGAGAVAETVEHLLRRNRRWPPQTV